ncbi:hypothetical protein Hanom_Chr09g00822011 [Helianthus anomalus]
MMLYMFYLVTLSVLSLHCRWSLWKEFLYPYISSFPDLTNRFVICEIYLVWLY